MLQGRVAKNSYQSASIWSLNTEAGTGLIVSALHTLGEGYLGPGGSHIEEQLRDPNKQPGATRIYLVKENGSVDTLANVLFILYNPEVPPEQSGNHLRDILKRHDFFIGVIDSQKVVMEPLPGELGELLFTIVGWVARMESQRRSETTKAGLVRLVAQGKKLGRPKGSKDKRKRKRRASFN